MHLGTRRTQPASRERARLLSDADNLFKAKLEVTNNFILRCGERCGAALGYLEKVRCLVRPFEKLRDHGGFALLASRSQRWFFVITLGV